MTKEIELYLPEFKKKYAKLEKKHNLPSFNQMNRDFQIEKLAEVETDYLIREIRKFSGEKFFNYFRFIESLLNPSNASMFTDRKSTRLNSSHIPLSRMPSSA